MIEIDYVAFRCPLLLVKAKCLLRHAEIGDVFKFKVSDEHFFQDLKRKADQWNIAVESKQLAPLLNEIRKVEASKANDASTKTPIYQVKVSVLGAFPVFHDVKQ